MPFDPTPDLASTVAPIVWNRLPGPLSGQPCPCPGSGNLHYCSTPECLDRCHPPPHAAPRIQMAWRRFPLAVSNPNENSAPSITSTTIISNSLCLSGPHLITDYRLQHSAFSCLLLISVTWMWLHARCPNFSQEKKHPIFFEETFYFPWPSLPIST